MITKEKIIEVLQTCYDPEIPVDLWNLGLIYNIAIKNKTINILMTLTTPGCTMIDVIAQDIKNKVSLIKGVDSVDIETTFDPIWKPEMMSDIAKEKLGFTVRKNDSQSNWE
jgi:metal-sulfur cluster biosynthetic enzyme